MENLRWHPKRGVFSGKVDGDREATPEEIAVHFKKMEPSATEKRTEAASQYAEALNRVGRRERIMAAQGKPFDAISETQKIMESYNQRLAEIEVEEGDTK